MTTLGHMTSCGQSLIRLHKVMKATKRWQLWPIVDSEQWDSEVPQ